MDQLVRSEIEAHDRYQMEFKYDYELLPDQETRYKVETYIFVPRSLAINSDTYPNGEFYRDLQNYVRLKTPNFTLNELASSPSSPLVRVQHLLAQPDWFLRPGADVTLITNFKFLRATLKSALDDCLARLRQELTSAKEKRPPIPVMADWLTAALQETHAILETYRTLEPQVKSGALLTRLHRSFALTDESISLVVEESFVDVVILLERHKLRRELGELVQQIADCTEAEAYYRQARHYGSVIAHTADSGEFLFRMSVLKKFTSSVLFLSTSVHREGTTLEQVLYAIAAGVSMVFATVVAFYFQRRYGNFTSPFFLALVIGYMFKDRIKDMMRLRSARFLRNVVYDRRTLIKTLDGLHELGYLRERVDFVQERHVPAAVITARNRQFITELDSDGQGESILRYEKAVVLYKDGFRKIYADAPEIDAVKDIMRFDIRAFLRKMDDPYQDWSFLEAGKLHRMRLPRVYYLNFIQHYITPVTPTPDIKRIRATLSRKGIQKVETFG